MANVHIECLPALRRFNGAVATWLRTAGLALVLASSAAGARNGEGRLTAAPSDAGTTPATIASAKIVRVDGGGLLYVPASAGAEQLPLLLLFPGTGGDGNAMVSALEPVAERGRFALLGFSPGQGNFKSVDNFFDDLEAGRAHAKVTWPAPRFGRDAERIDGALKRVFATVPIDRKHVGLLGFSHGASYALSLGTANPQLFSSIAALSPGIMILKGDVAGGQRVFLTHGRSDSVQPYRRTACSFVPRLTELGYEVEFHGFAGGHESPSNLVVGAIAHFLGTGNRAKLRNAQRENKSAFDLRQYCSFGHLSAGGCVKLGHGTIERRHQRMLHFHRF